MIWFNKHTLNELNGFEEDKEWALRSNAHAVLPVFANEFWVRKGAPPSGVRTVFSPRSRFEPKISLATTFFAKRSVSNAILSNPCATFTQFWKGSSQSFCLCERDVISSSSDFFCKSNFPFSERYISFSISWSRYPVRSRSNLILIFKKKYIVLKKENYFCK